MLLLGFIGFKTLGAGARLEFPALSITPGSVLMGMIPLIGLFAAAGLCFFIGVGLCVHGIVPPEDEKVLPPDFEDSTRGSEYHNQLSR